MPNAKTPPTLPPYVPQEEKMVQAIEHVFYEARRLEVAYIVCATAIPGKVMDDALELILLHTRTLLDFFTGKRSNKRRREEDDCDDILCTDFGFPSPPLNIPGRRRINKEVAHLTYSRCGKSQMDKLWDFPPIVEPVSNEARAFLAFAIKKYGVKIVYADQSPRPVALSTEINEWLAVPLPKFAPAYLVNQSAKVPVVSGGRPVAAGGSAPPEVTFLG